MVNLMTKHSIGTQLNYLSPSVGSSLYRNGKVFTYRDSHGNDSAFKGAEMTRQNVVINNARANDKDTIGPQLEREGFELLNRPLQDSDLSFFDQQQLLQKYYPECESIVQQATGATHVFAFDHNVRSGHKKDQKQTENAQAVQQPIQYVHGDYTLASAPQRLLDLASPPRTNDTLRSILGEDKSLLTNDFVSHVLDNNKRFVIINVWRNIASSPVVSNPLALCDGQTMSQSDLVVFEVRYADRIGENYFAKHSSSHQWWYYPEMTRNEVILIKQWDSTGVINDLDNPSKEENSEAKDMSCKFSLHSAFADPTTPQDAPERQSIEVRCMALFDYI